nr:lactase-phlorizin hydrolase-like [Leptinotarsa decemlineata]
MVTLYHWDLPQSIQDKGGWTNEETIQYFVDYARIVFQNFPDVDYWITIHEPKQVCRGGYGNGSLAPFIFDSGRADYKCAYVILKAHAAVYHMYKNEFPDSKGKVSIALDGSWSQPRVNTKNEIKAAKRRHDFEFGLYANPIFVNDWPQTVKQIVYARSEKEHFNGSRLPYFSPEEISEIRGTADFMALNYYGARGVEDAKVYYDTYGYDNDLAVKYWQNDSWVEMSSGLSVVPWSIQSFLSYVRDDFHVTEIIITGNGVEDEHPTQDNFRINYIADHLQYILKAIYKNGINVTGYTYCNLLDSFEWNEAYSPHYGLYSVDDDKSRSAKDSVDFYRRVATEHKIPVDIHPPGYPTTAESESTISSRTTTTTMETTITTSTTGTTDERKHSGSTSSSGVSGLLLTVSMSVSIYLKLF